MYTLVKKQNKFHNNFWCFLLGLWVGNRNKLDIKSYILQVQLINMKIHENWAGGIEGSINLLQQYAICLKGLREIMKTSETTR